MEAQSSLSCYKSFVMCFLSTMTLLSPLPENELSLMKIETNSISHGLLWQTATWCDWSLCFVLFCRINLKSQIQFRCANMYCDFYPEFDISVTTKNDYLVKKPWTDCKVCLSPRDGPREGQVHCLFFLVTWFISNQCTNLFQSMQGHLKSQNMFGNMQNLSRFRSLPQCDLKAVLCISLTLLSIDDS